MLDPSDPLQELLEEDTQSVDRNRLAAFLKSYVRFDKETKELQFLPGFTDIISNEAKVEVILVAAKARSLIFEEAEGLMPKEIINLEVMPEGSVKSSLKKLSDTRKIKKDADGRYLIPGYHINEIINRLGKE